MHIFSEVLLISCLFGYLLWIAILIKKGYRPLLTRLKFFLIGWVQLMGEERFTKRIMIGALSILPVLIFLLKLPLGLISSLSSALLTILLILLLWCLFNLFIHTLVTFVSVQHDLLTKLFLYLFISMIIVALALQQPKDSFASWHILAISLVLISTYITNFLIMSRIMKLIKSGKINIENGWKVVILIIILFILTLTLALYFANLILPNGFSQENLTAFDLLYYTVITFATIGYGDIVPIAPLTKGISMITTITSVMCLAVLLNSMLSISSEEQSKKTPPEHQMDPQE